MEEEERLVEELVTSRSSKLTCYLSMYSCYDS